MQKQQTLAAYMDRGIWWVDCTVCGMRLKVDQSTHRAICTHCYPDLLTTLQHWLKPNLSRTVPDIELRDKALKQAQEDGHHYTATFPAERAQIEAVLRMRPSPVNMNWYPPGHSANRRHGFEEQTVGDLIKENHEHGVDMTNFKLPPSRSK